MTATENWWRRPAGGREVLQIALPLVISSLSWTIMTFTDRILLRWYSGEAMTAAFSGSVIWFNSLCLPLGICAFANTFVSQYFGAGNREGVSRSAWQAVWIALAFTIPCGLLGWLGPWLFQLAGHAPSMAVLEEQYFGILVWGSGGMLVSQAASAYFGGQGRTRFLMFVDAIFAGLNVVLDLILIFGWQGIPAMGIAGAAWATVISLWLKALTWIWLMLRRHEHEQYATRRTWRLDLSLMLRMLRYGGPAGLQMFIDVLGFSVFLMLLGRIGTTAAEATTLAFSISTVAFMPIHGFGQAAGILVGQHLGENRVHLAARSAWTAIAIGIGYMSAISLAFLLLPDLFLNGFFANADPVDPQQDAAVHDLAVVLLRFVAAYNIFDAAFMIFSGALKGAGDTGFILWTSLVLALALGGITWLAVVQFQSDVLVCWSIVTGWICVAGTVFALRFLAGQWREMRVIERTSPAP